MSEGVTQPAMTVLVRVLEEALAALPALLRLAELDSQDREGPNQ